MNKNEVQLFMFLYHNSQSSKLKKKARSHRRASSLQINFIMDYYGPNKGKADERGKVRRFFEDSTFNGAIYMFDSGSILKRVFWGLVLLIAVGGFLAVTGWHIYQLVRDPTSTSITLTRETELTFPAVTICSLSLLNVTTLRSAANTFITADRILEDMKKLFDDIRYRDDIEACQSTARSLAANVGINPNWGALTNLAKNELDIFLRSCRFAGKDCTNDFTPVSTTGGVCYTFNGPSANPPRTVGGTGMRKGLQLQLSQSDQLFSLTNDHGFRIVIHNPDEHPRPDSEGIAVALKSTTYIGMRQITSIDKTRFSEGFRCRGDYQNSNQNLSFPGYLSYSLSLCQSDCFYSYVARSCNCIEDEELYTPMRNSQPYSQLRKCNFTDICCEYQAFREANDTCDCPPKCKTVRHTTTVSSSTNQESYVNVNVYYESFITETRETEDSYTAWSLISDIGGNTGLFLGLTLLSGVELLMLVVELIKDCCFKSKGTSKPGTV